MSRQAATDCSKDSFFPAGPTQMKVGTRSGHAGTKARNSIAVPYIGLTNRGIEGSQEDSKVSLSNFSSC